MQMPSVSHVAKDPERNITFNVLAYRQMSQADVLQSIRYFRSTKSGRRLKKNTTYTMSTIFGARD